MAQNSVLMKRRNAAEMNWPTTLFSPDVINMFGRGLGETPHHHDFNSFFNDSENCDVKFIHTL